MNNWIESRFWLLSPPLKKEDSERFGDHGFSIICWMHGVGAAQYRHFGNHLLISTPVFFSSQHTHGKLAVFLAGDFEIAIGVLHRKVTGNIILHTVLLLDPTLVQCCLSLSIIRGTKNDQVMRDWPQTKTPHHRKKKTHKWGNANLYLSL